MRVGMMSVPVRTRPGAQVTNARERVWFPSHAHAVPENSLEFARRGARKAAVRFFRAALRNARLIVIVVLDRWQSG
jgi:hypothetical protein